MGKPKTVEELRGPSKVRMTAKAFREAIDTFGLSQTRAGEFFGFSDRQGQRMSLGEVKPPPAVIHLIKLMLKYRIDPADLDPRFKDLPQRPEPAE
jgi:hypothetical protein